MLVHLIIVGVTVLDLVTKILVQKLFDVHQSVVVIPGLFNLTYIRNQGAAFGIFQQQRWPLIAVSVAMLVFLVRSRRQFLGDGGIPRVAYGLMCAGIIGNLVDRMRQGYVVDFLDFHWQTHRFPSFNVADSAICVGVGLFILQQFLTWRRERAVATVVAAG